MTNNKHNTVFFTKIITQKNDLLLQIVEIIVLSYSHLRKNHFLCITTNGITTYEGPINNLELEVPTYEEVNQIIKSLKTNKAAGPDEILPEFIKKMDVSH